MVKVIGGDSDGSHSTSQILRLFNEMWSGGSFNGTNGDMIPMWPLNVLVLKNYNAVTQKSWAAYQYQFVKTRFPRLWSNRDMGLFSFWPISPQFAKESPPKALKRVDPSESHFRGPFLCFRHGL